MKLIIATCLKEYQKTVEAIFREAKIKVFSVTSTVGNKNEQALELLDNWFASGEEHFDSIVLFSFTGNENAIEAIELVKKHNLDIPSDFPIRAFLLSVEQSSY